MTVPKHIKVLALVGVLGIGAAWAIRHYYFRSRTALDIALTDPRVRKVQKELDKQEEAVNSSPNDVALRWKLADRYQKIGLIDRALPHLVAITRMQPDNYDAQLALANVQLAMSKQKEAEATFRLITRKWPKQAMGWQGLSTALYHQQRHMEAMEAIRPAMTLQPNDPNHRFIFATEVLKYVDQFPNPEAYQPFVRVSKKELENLLSVWPMPGDIHYKLGDACSMLQENKQAIDHYKQALALMPDRYYIAASLARSYMAISDRPQARKLLQGYVDKGKATPEMHDMLGQLIQTSGEQGAIEKARKEFKTAVKMMPENPLFLERLGSACVRANDLKTAREAFERAVILNPERAFPYQQLAAIYTRQGDIPRSTAAAKMATQMVFNDNQLRQLQLLSRVHPENTNLYLALGDRYRDMGLLGASRDKYYTVLKLEPNNEKAKTGLAELEKKKPVNIIPIK